uniref:Gfo/Idh/MocA-like oxidoreductase N-terminal domain-containing protein n=1 Tax=Xiphophorus couchianus TaxID=32473 RepID=A0A3B5L1T3_9TELE
MYSPVHVIVVGAGCRGENYAKFASIHPKRMKVVAVADPRKFARTKMQQQHKIEDKNVFEDWKSIVEREKFADAVLICTPDRIHKDPAVAFAKKGYHILLEKPMATTAEDCRAIVEACTQADVMLSVGHVLRYDPLIHKIKVLIDAGVVGDVIHIQHLEPVGFYHFAHSFVRGNWRNEAESSFALLAKSSKTSSAGDRCVDCSVERNCPYSACKIYVDRVKQGHTGWPVSVICPNSLPDVESVNEALRSGPYGRCVYECDNDVCSNQVVNMEFEGGLTAAFSMVAFTKEICQRKTTIYGSKGEMSYDSDEICVFEFLTQRSTKHTASSEALEHYGMSGHGGADYHLMNAFISAVANNDPSMIRSGPEETLISHLLVFEAERSRVEGRVVYCGDSAGL